MPIPSSTILLLSLPQTTLVGLDTLAITPSPRFHGFSQIPPGWHFLYAGASASLSARTGFWFNVPASFPPSSSSSSSVVSSTTSSPFLRVFEWNSNTECLCPISEEPEISRWRTRLANSEDSALRVGLLPYRINKERATPASLSNADGTGSISTTREEDDETSADDEDAEENSKSTPRGPPAQEAPPQNPGAFAALTSHITPALLSRITGVSPPSTSSSSASATIPDSWSISTTCSALEDRDDFPGLMSAGERAAATGLQERELRFLKIDLKQTWREGAIGTERTRDARDRSGALERVVMADKDAGVEGYENGDGNGNGKRGGTGKKAGAGEQQCWGSELLGEMQVTFLMVLLLANWSCLAQWKRILELVLTSHAALVQHPQFFAEFLGLLREQLQRCGDVEGGLFDVKGYEAGFLKKLLRGFRRTVIAASEDYLDAKVGESKSKKETSSRMEEVGDKKDSSGSSISIIASLKEVRKEMQDSEEWLKEEWAWELGDEFVRRGMVELEDGERVEVEMDDMEGEDERGEYAPVIVDLGEHGERAEAEMDDDMEGEDERGSMPQ